jgi:small subunit ribosomal protein S21
MRSNKNKPLRGSTVIVGEMPVEIAIRKFKQRVDDLGILEIVKKNTHYEKPTTERKRKKGAAKSRWQKKLRDQQLPKKMY